MPRVANKWTGNSVNNIQDKPNYCLVTADGWTFTDWYNQIIQSGMRNPYIDTERRLHSKILSTASYPWLNEDNNVNQVTLFDDRRITDITQHDDGTVSFTFHASNGSGIQGVQVVPKTTDVYTLSGQKLRADGRTEMLPRGIYIVNGQKIVKR